MYVTDVPVIDRLTDPTLGPILSAVEALADALDELSGWSEEAQEKLFPVEEVRAPWYSSEAVAEGLYKTTEATLTAHGELIDALHLLRPTTL